MPTTRSRSKRSRAGSRKKPAAKTARKRSAKKTTKPKPKRKVSKPKPKRPGKKALKALKAPPKPPPEPPKRSTKGRKRKTATATPKKSGKGRKKAAPRRGRQPPNPKRRRTTSSETSDDDVGSEVEELTAGIARMTTAKKERPSRSRLGPASEPMNLDAYETSPAQPARRFTSYNEFMQDELQTRETPRPGALKGRENEHRGIEDFIVTSLQGDATGGSLYLCGSPGTGKSATMYNIHRNLTETIRTRGVTSNPRIVKVCAMQCKRPQDIYPMVLRALDPQTQIRSPHEACQKLAAMFTSPGAQKTVLIVDEIDGLLSGQVTVLYRLFEWPKQRNSSLVLIGIANSIDLTNRFLPRLQQRKAHPKLIIFRPYTAAQLSEVVLDRLAAAQASWRESGNPSCEAPVVQLFDKMSLMIITKKVASMYGDVRKTLEVCRECLDTIKASGQDQVSFPVAKAVIKRMYGSRFSELIGGLPNQQQTLLVVSMILFRTMPAADRSKVSEFYTYMINRHELPKVASHLFGDMLSNLVSLGLLSQVKSRGRGRSTLPPLKCMLQQDDIEMALEGNRMLLRLLTAKHKVAPHFHAKSK